jgi:hypothetical protein
MPTSLMDLFSPDSYQPTNALGQPGSLSDALASRSNALIGMGAGLMSPRGLLSSPWSQALQGYQKGAEADTKQAALQAEIERRKTEDARQAAQRALAQSNWERQFARSDPANTLTEFGKMMQDQGITKGSPEFIAAARRYSDLRMQDPAGAITWQEDASGNKVPYFQDPRKGTVTAITPEGQPPATSAGNPYASGAKMSTDEGKSALFADRAATAHAAISKYENINSEPGGRVGAMVQQNLPAGVANALVSPERGRAMDAQRAFLNALLRRESGAAISASEFDSYGKEYFPQPFDSPAQIEAKRKHRAEVIAGLAREGGKGYRPNYSFDESGNIALGAPTYSKDAAGIAGPGAAAPAPAPTPAPEATKTIGNKTYRKINGQWFED